jgi:hypothetical protein
MLAITEKKKKKKAHAVSFRATLLVMHWLCAVRVQHASIDKIECDESTARHRGCVAYVGHGWQTSDLTSKENDVNTDGSMNKCRHSTATSWASKMM